MATRHCLWHAQLTGWVDGDSACLPASSGDWPSLLTTDGQPVHADANFRPERRSACPQCACITYSPPVILVAALMEWSDLRDMRQHTEHTIAAVQDARVRYATTSHCDETRRVTRRVQSMPCSTTAVVAGQSCVTSALDGGSGSAISIAQAPPLCLGTQCVRATLQVSERGSGLGGQVLGFPQIL